MSELRNNLAAAVLLAALAPLMAGHAQADERVELRIMETTNIHVHSSTTITIETPRRRPWVWRARRG